MALTAQELQRLHRVHQQITELQEKQDAGPRRLKITENRLSATDQRQLDLKEHLARAHSYTPRRLAESRVYPSNSRYGIPQDGQHAVERKCQHSGQEADA